MTSDLMDPFGDNPPPFATADFGAERAKRSSDNPFPFAPVDLWDTNGIAKSDGVKADMFPASIWNYAKDNAELIGVNPAAIAIPAIAAAATAIREGWKIQPMLNNPGWTVQPIFWVALSGLSGTAKTPAMNAAMSPLAIIQADWADEDASAMAEYWGDMEIWKNAMKVWRKETGGLDKDTRPEKPEKPAVRYMTVDDITAERLVDIAKDNPAGIAVVKDELTGWIAGFDAYRSGGGGKDRAFYLTTFNGGRFEKDRVSTGRQVVKNLAASVVGGIQDDIVAKKLGQTEADGFLARFLFVQAVRSPSVDRRPDYDARDAYVATIGRLSSLGHENSCRDGREVVLMSREAAELREQVSDFVFQMIGRPAMSAGLRDHLAKLETFFVRLCLVFHMIECVEAKRDPLADSVSGETAERAHRLLMGFLLPEAVRIYGEVISAGPDVEHARWVAGYLLSKGLTTISFREIRRAFRAVRDNRHAIMAALKELEAASWIEPDGEVQEWGDGFRGKWTVNPQAHRLFAERAELERTRRGEVRAKIAS